MCEDSKFENLSKRLDLIKTMKAPLIACLQEVQNTYGYLCEETINLIAEKLKLSSERVYEVASFYSQFKLQKIGKHKVSVCLGTACYVKGAEEVYKEVKKILEIDEGETTKDEYYSLDTVRCVGCCSLAPLMLIDDKVYGKVEPGQVKTILDDFRKEN